MKYIIMDGNRPSSHLVYAKSVGVYTDCKTGKTIALSASQLIYFDWLNAKETKYNAGYFIAWSKRQARQENSVLNWMEKNFFEGDSEVYSLSPTETISKEVSKLPSWFDLYQ